MKPVLTRRTHNKSKISFSANISPLLQRIYASRNAYNDNDINYSLHNLYNYQKLKDINKASEIIARAIINKEKIIIVGDFDTDGATSCALAVTALNNFGAINPSFLIPNRLKHGYGLTTELAKKAIELQPDLIITVDNGISNHAGVSLLKKHSIKVIITDHHLPGKTVPNADAIVNPNQKDCNFPGKNTAGVGVIFYTMCAVRQALVNKNWFNLQLQKPNMSNLLDLVAIGTVADVVPLDKNNRIFVQQGLNRIRSKQCCIGIQALIDISTCNLNNLIASDIGFSLAPKLNAAGRLDDMSLGVELLMSNNYGNAKKTANILNNLNKERRSIEAQMQEDAFSFIADFFTQDTIQKTPSAFCLYHPQWHQGVIGILASRIKELVNRPGIIFSQDKNGLLKGSARSIDGFHIQEVLTIIANENPKLLESFGGHAMAAGLAIKIDNLEKFKKIFVNMATNLLKPEQLKPNILTDGTLNDNEINIEIAELLRNSGPWGQKFPEPIFEGDFKIVEKKILKDKHLKLKLSHLNNNSEIDAIMFNIDKKINPQFREKQIKIAYRMDINEYKEKTKLQLLIQHIELIN